ncbi:unnamed protein product [Bursaphelenchus xylophilus]|uniref:(pine wood nematode) hypothetical protein n=1 Tax=Bursaphelenchus xylophilus TaxID=6326 RepID=A0A1I7SED0_BURXY|nr:unnamed protein product [Bursaphelenchus xylophilus]CAG9087512.1 unnamed protein product [Bursaphelenchus xylophilus]
MSDKRIKEGLFIGGCHVAIERVTLQSQINGQMLGRPGLTVTSLLLFIDLVPFFEYSTWFIFISVLLFKFFGVNPRKFTISPGDSTVETAVTVHLIKIPKKKVEFVERVVPEAEQSPSSSAYQCFVVRSERVRIAQPNRALTSNRRIMSAQNLLTTKNDSFYSYDHSSMESLPAVGSLDPVGE